MLRARLAARLAGPLPNAAFLAETAGEVTGALLAVVVPRDFSDTLIACETTLYIRPAHRGGRTLPRLIEAYKAWARAQGARKAYLGVSTGIHPQRTVRAYEKLGGKLDGHNVVMDL